MNFINKNKEFRKGKPGFTENNPWSLLDPVRDKPTRRIRTGVFSMYMYTSPSNVWAACNEYQHPTATTTQTTNNTPPKQQPTNPKTEQQTTTNPLTKYRTWLIEHYTLSCMGNLFFLYVRREPRLYYKVKKKNTLRFPVNMHIFHVFAVNVNNQTL